MVRLLRDVQFSLMAPGNDAKKKRTASAHANEPIRVTGKSLEFERESRTMRLNGPVEAETRSAHLHAGKLKLTLDAAFRAEKLVVTPGPNGKNPELESLSADGSTNLSAETITAQFAREGWLTRIEGAGGVPARGEATQTKLQADKLEMEFGAEGKAKKLIATGNVSTERAVGGKPVQTATAQSGTAQLPASGGWSQMDLQGNVRLKEGDRSGLADHAAVGRATQTALLAGKALARDATS